MGIVVVDVCQANKITSIDIEAILEEEFPEVAVIMNDCLSYCGLCANSYYAQVNSTFTRRAPRAWRCRTRRCVLHRARLRGRRARPCSPATSRARRTPRPWWRKSKSGSPMRSSPSSVGTTNRGPTPGSSTSSR